MKISVIIANYNGIIMLKNCLDSLLAHDRKPDQIIVVDNGSSDGSAGEIRSGYPEVTLVPLSSNAGFTGANNAGLEVSEGDFIVLLNNDCIVESGWLKSLEKRMEDGSVAAVASSMRNIAELSVMDSAGGEIDWMCFSRDIGKGMSADGFASTKELPFPCGGAVMIRRSALPDRSTLFWNSLFLYQEDLDLGFELLRTGWKVVYEPEAVVRHMHSATSGSGSFLKESYCIRNRLLVMRKHFDGNTFSALLPVIRKWQSLWAALSLVRGRITLTKAIMKGTAQGLSMEVPDFKADISLNEVFTAHAKVYEPCSSTKHRLYRKAEQIIRSSF